jgi:predicted nucleotidyltransferase
VQLSTDTLIRKMQPILAADGNVRLALLFGSRARGQADDQSDVDIAVDAPDADLWELGARISRTLGVEVDVVPLAPASIPLLEQFVAEAKVIYEAGPGHAASWRARVLSELETDRPWYRRMRDAWLRRVAREGLSDGK